MGGTPEGPLGWPSARPRTPNGAQWRQSNWPRLTQKNPRCSARSFRRRLRRIEYEADIRDARCVHDRKHLCDRAIWHTLIGLKIDTLPLPLCRHLERHLERAQRHLTVIESNDAILVDRDYQATLRLDRLG